jgi:hypothetical protein
VTVPLDRTGATPGTIACTSRCCRRTARARRHVPDRRRPGPGLGRLVRPRPGFNRQLMQFMFPGYTLVAFDNRGTGKSG